LNDGRKNELLLNDSHSFEKNFFEWQSLGKVLNHKTGCINLSEKKYFIQSVLFFESDTHTSVF